MKKIIKQASIIGALAIVAAIIILGITGVPAKAQQNSLTGNAAGENINPVKSITAQSNLPNPSAGKVQEVLLIFKNYEYQLEPSTLVKGIPVRLTVDLDSVYGCMRDVVIPSFSVRKYVRSGDNVIEFTPDKSGTFNIRCSMNMGRGTFSVQDADGEIADYTETNPSSSGLGLDSGTCRIDQAGGCGCRGYS